jgi:hypothetical protein
MPDTRALFEELVRDKPALLLDIAAIERRAEGTIRRRRALAGVAGVVVLAAAGSLVVDVAGQHPARPEPVAPAGLAVTSGAPPVPSGLAVTSAAPPALSGLAFTSAEQIKSADARVVDAMLATAGSGAKVTLSTPAVITATTRRTIHEVSYQQDGATVTLLENVSAPSGAAELANMGITGKDQNSPCATPHHAPVTQKDGSVATYATSIQCVGQSLPDGAMLWTFISRYGAGSASDSPPIAVIEEPDGSTVFVQTSALKSGQDAAEAMTRDQVGAFTIALENAWQG